MSLGRPQGQSARGPFAPVPPLARNPAMSVSLPSSPADLIPRVQFLEGIVPFLKIQPQVIPNAHSSVSIKDFSVSDTLLLYNPPRLEQDENKRLICLEDFSW